jgi:hypothetical protein
MTGPLSDWTSKSKSLLYWLCVVSGISALVRVQFEEVEALEEALESLLVCSLLEGTSLEDELSSLLCSEDCSLEELAGVDSLEEVSSLEVDSLVRTLEDSALLEDSAALDELEGESLEEAVGPEDLAGSPPQEARTKQAKARRIALCFMGLG